MRVALGAPRSRFRGSVLRQVAGATLPGIAFGVAAAWLLGCAARTILFGVDGANPLALGAAAAVLAAAALGATYLPAWRASTMDPMVVLRYE